MECQGNKEGGERPCINHCLRQSGEKGKFEEQAKSIQGKKEGEGEKRREQQRYSDRADVCVISRV